jgi:hypothetical protein
VACVLLLVVVLLLLLLLLVVVVVVVVLGPQQTEAYYLQSWLEGLCQPPLLLLLLPLLGHGSGWRAMCGIQGACGWL